MRTGTVSYKLEDLKKGVIIPIGFVGENDFTRVIFDAEEIYKKFPNASVSMKVQPPKGVIYPATVTRDGNTVIWQVKEADVANRGGGELQLTFIDGETKIKTYIAKTDVKRSLAGNGPAPEPVQDWVDNAEEVLDDLAAMDNIAKTAEAGDIGKALSPKTVEDGVVTEWQYIEMGGGTEDYSDLENKPSIGGVTLAGDKSLHELGIAAENDIPDVSGKANLTVIAPAFDQATANDAGSLVTYTDGVVYVLPDGHTAGTTWANTTKTATNIDTELRLQKSAIQGKPDEKNSTKSNVDLDISDEDGYVVARFADGHIKTKKFDSKELFQNSTKSGVSLDIADPDGYVVARFKGGHIQTELFNSADIKYSSLKGKKIVNFGDSIFGNKRPPYDISTYIANETGATVYNCGFGGCRMATHDYSRRNTWGQFSMYELADAIASDDWTGQDAAVADTTWSDRPTYFAETLSLLKSIDFTEVDIVTIAYGTNDFTAAIPLDNANDAKDTSTFAGALRYSIETLLTAYPNLRIVCCGQTYRWWDSSGDFVDDSNDHEVGGQLLTQFVEKTEEVTKEYNLQFLNNYYIGIGRFTRSTFFTLPDTTHPNNIGTKLIATHMIKELY